MNYEQLERFTLHNGLKVYIHCDHSIPKVFGAVMVHAGAKHDPEDAGGVAHYFEHIMFKGTDRIGTWDYSQEKPFLDQIEKLYERLSQSTDEASRLDIQKEINHYSIQAAPFAIANDLDHILKSIGSTKVNAYTSFDHTVYHNTLPSGQLRAWLEIYAERFRKPVFRLFQSELETIYEEKNRLLDDPMRALMTEWLIPALFRTHPYGTHSLIGSTEALKNPSLAAMRQFFETYYVANNMSLILCGDIDLSQAKPWIEDCFGTLPSGDLPLFNPPIEAPLERQVLEYKATPFNLDLMAFRTVPESDDDFSLIDLCHQILVNGDTGLLDVHTHQNNWVSAFAFSLGFVDYGHSLIGIIPPNNDGFEISERRVFEALDQLKQGLFSETLLESLKRSKEVMFLKAFEKFDTRAQLLLSAVGHDKDWSKVCQFAQQIRQYGIEDIRRVAQKYFKPESVLILRSSIGKSPFERISKPNFAPIPAEVQHPESPFSLYLKSIKAQETPLRFIDFHNDISIEQGLGAMWDCFVSPNPINTIFTLHFYFHFDRNRDSRLSILSDYLNNVGSESLAYAEFRQALQSMGADAYWQSFRHDFCLSITGFEEDLERILALIRDWVWAPSLDQTQVQKVIEETIVNLRQMLQTPQSISEALMEWALYGEQSSYLTQLPLRSIKRLSPESLTALLPEIQKQGGHIVYCGQRSSQALWDTIVASGLLQHSSIVSPKRLYRSRIAHPTRQLWIMNDHQCIQNQIGVYIPLDILSPLERVVSMAFNHYFGMGMTSLVFQEIREFRSLAYGAQVCVRQSEDGAFDLPSMCVGALQTQADKTEEAIDVLEHLFDDMPLKPERWPIIQTHLIQSMATSRPDFRQLGSHVSELWMIGYREDPAKIRKDYLESITFDDIVAFYKKHIQGHPRHYMIYGHTDKLTASFKEHLGQTRILKTKDIVSL